MTHFIIRRLAHSVLVLAGVITIVFFIMRLSGDPAVLFLPVGASEEEIQQVRKAMGLDQPLHVQYVHFVLDAVQGDFGQSPRYRAPAMSVVLERLPSTLTLTAVALGLCTLVAVPLGISAAVRRDSLWDIFATTLALIGQSVPVFWLGALLILLFGVELRWLPTSGAQGWQSLILPGITLAGLSMALVARMIRSTLLEVLGLDYIRTARAKGLSERVVLFRHALRNAAIPVVTVLGLQVSPMIGGAIVTEQVFAYPGLGRLVVQSVTGRDFPVVQAVVVVTASVVLLMNVLVDLVYVWLDPRVVFD